MTNKQKLLCLHGFRQNATIFKAKTGSLQKMLKAEAEFIFLSAPHKIPGYDVPEEDEADERAWWFSQPSSFSSRDETNSDIGLAESLKTIEAFNKEKGPFNGILGFSQGAALTGLLCSLKQRGEISLDFQFVIIVSGFKSRCSLHQKYYDQKINISSLHVIGETDELVSTDVSRALAELFVNPSYLYHPGGHYVPGKSTYKKNYIDFLEAQNFAPLLQQWICTAVDKTEAVCSFISFHQQSIQRAMSPNHFKDELKAS